jgi:hypothetical protein
LPGVLPRISNSPGTGFPAAGINPTKQLPHLGQWLKRRLDCVVGIGIGFGIPIESGITLPDMEFGLDHM